MTNKPAAASHVDWWITEEMADGKCTALHPPPKYKRPLHLLVRKVAVSEGSGKNITVFPPPVGIGKTQDSWYAS